MGLLAEGVGELPTETRLLASKASRSVAWETPFRWFRRVLWTFGGLATAMAILATVVVTGWRDGWLQIWVMNRMMEAQAKGDPPMPWPPRGEYRPWSENPANPHLSAVGLLSADEIYRPTNIWDVHLLFATNGWKDLGPLKVPTRGFIRADGTMDLRNPKARRSGLSGAMGLDFPWSKADIDFAGVPLTNVATRFKGNGTYLGGAHGWKRPFKIQLSKNEKGTSIAGLETLNFGNLSADNSQLADALAYEYFREIGVPASRTAYAFLTLTVAGEFEKRPLGLYVMVENLDAKVLERLLGAKKGSLLKPVTTSLFKDLGDDWEDYKPVYDPKTKVSKAHQHQIIQFSKLLTHAPDGEFDAKVGDFLDLEEIARVLAGLVLQSSYDGLLSNGQNFYLYVHPRTDTIGIIPWDLDHSWGEIPMVGTMKDREEASIFHAWAGEMRLWERLMGNAEFQRIYRAEIERQLQTVFIPERLSRRLDELAAAIRPAVQQESPERLERFEKALANDPSPQTELSGNPFDADKPVFRLKRFFRARAIAVRSQLDGKSEGKRLSLQRMDSKGRERIN